MAEQQKQNMKAVLQRVKSASVTVDGTLVSSIGKGILVFAGLGKDDTTKDAETMARKVLKLRMWDDEDGGKWKRNVVDVGGEVLCVSQFTLLASTKKGNKPDFHKAAGPDLAKELYTTFFRKVQEIYEKDKVKDGIFQAMMDVALVNDGPVGVDYRSEDGAVTIEIDTSPPNATPGSKSEKRYSFEDLAENLQKISTEFKIPAELLE